MDRALPRFSVLLEIKIRIEERFMLAEFPDDYPRYRQLVPPAGTRPAPDQREQGGQHVGALASA